MGNQSLASNGIVGCLIRKIHWLDPILAGFNTLSSNFWSQEELLIQTTRNIQNHQFTNLKCLLFHFKGFKIHFSKLSWTGKFQYYRLLMSRTSSLGRICISSTIRNIKYYTTVVAVGRSKTNKPGVTYGQSRSRVLVVQL